MATKTIAECLALAADITRNAKSVVDAYVTPGYISIEISLDEFQRRFTGSEVRVCEGNWHDSYSIAEDGDGYQLKWEANVSVPDRGQVSVTTIADSTCRQEVL